MRPRLRTAWVRAYRLAACASLGALLAYAGTRDGPSGVMPLGLREVVAIVPDAAVLDVPDHEGVQQVRDAAGMPRGLALTTAPDGDGILGYCGPTEVVLVVDDARRILGARLRRSADTPEHVADVRGDAHFWQAFVGRDATAWGDDTVRIDGVSGATATCAAIVEAVGRRLARAAGSESKPRGAALVASDVLVALFGIGGLALAFHGVRRGRTLFRVAAVLGLGVATAALVGIGTYASLARYGPWLGAGTAVGVLAAYAWLVPWATGRNPYCGQLCPHGAVQELFARVARRRSFALPPTLRAGLRAVPLTLVTVAVGAVVVGIPLDLATLEGFDAWSLGAAASIAVAVVGGVAALFEPMAYCRYGCATGRFIALGTTHVRAQFGARDVVWLALVAFAGALTWARDGIHAWLVGGAS